MIATLETYVVSNVLIKKMVYVAAKHLNILHNSVLRCVSWQLSHTKFLRHCVAANHLNIPYNCAVIVVLSRANCTNFFLKSD